MTTLVAGAQVEADVVERTGACGDHSRGLPTRIARREASRTCARPTVARGKRTVRSPKRPVSRTRCAESEKLRTVTRKFIARRARAARQVGQHLDGVEVDAVDALEVDLAQHPAVVPPAAGRHRGAGEARGRQVEGLADVLDADDEAVRAAALERTLRGMRSSNGMYAPRFVPTALAVDPHARAVVDRLEAQRPVVARARATAAGSPCGTSRRCRASTRALGPARSTRSGPASGSSPRGRSALEALAEALVARCRGGRATRRPSGSGWSARRCRGPAWPAWRRPGRAAGGAATARTSRAARRGAACSASARGWGTRGRAEGCGSVSSAARLAADRRAEAEQGNARAGQRVARSAGRRRTAPSAAPSLGAARRRGSARSRRRARATSPSRSGRSRPRPVAAQPRAPARRAAPARARRSRSISRAIAAASPRACASSSRSTLRALGVVGRQPAGDEQR